MPNIHTASFIGDICGLENDERLILEGLNFAVGYKGKLDFKNTKINKKTPLLFISKGVLAGADDENRTREPHPYQGPWRVAHDDFLRSDDQNTCTQLEING